MHRDRVETPDAEWTIAVGDTSDEAGSRLLQIFDWMCGAASRQAPMVAVHADNLEYVEKALALVRAGEPIESQIDSAHVIRWVLSDDPASTTTIGIWLLRFVAYLGDESREFGSFTVPLPHAIALLAHLFDREGDLIAAQDGGRGRASICTTERGSREAGVAFEIRLPSLPVELMEGSNPLDGPRLSRWCTGAEV